MFWSACFLTCYLIYHFGPKEPTRFEGEGALARILYLRPARSRTSCLAAAIVPLIAVTVWFAAKGKLAKTQEDREAHSAPLALCVRHWVSLSTSSSTSSSEHELLPRFVGAVPAGSCSFRFWSRCSVALVFFWPMFVSGRDLTPQEVQERLAELVGLPSEGPGVDRDRVKLAAEAIEQLARRSRDGERSFVELCHLLPEHAAACESSRPAGRGVGDG